MIQKQLTYEPRLNGFTNWIETFFEVTSHLAITVDDPSSLSHAARCRGGQGAVRELAEILTDEFEVRYHDGYNERWQYQDWLETIDEFLNEKEREHKLITHT
jgi:hypothetical protein